MVAAFNLHLDLTLIVNFHSYQFNIMKHYHYVNITLIKLVFSDNWLMKIMKMNHASVQSIRTITDWLASVYHSFKAPPHEMVFCLVIDNTM